MWSDSGGGLGGGLVVVEDFFGCFMLCSDGAHIWKEVGFVKLESGGLLVTGHLPFLDLFLPLLRSHGGGLPGGALVALMPWEINDQATFSQHFPQWTVTLWPGLGSGLCDTICY